MNDPRKNDVLGQKQPEYGVMSRFVCGSSERASAIYGEHASRTEMQIANGGEHGRRDFFRTRKASERRALSLLVAPHDIH
jgi:hypothetical protein